MLRQNFLFWSEASKPSTLVMRDSRNSGSASEKRPPKTRSIPTRANPHVRCGAVSRKQVAAMRWEALQKRLEAVQERRRDREKETSRRMQAADRHNQARERRKVIRRCCCGWCWWRCCLCWLLMVEWVGPSSSSAPTLRFLYYGRLYSHFSCTLLRLYSGGGGQP